MSDHFGANEDFEKVDADQEDDITSTSMTGDMAEEDAYMGRSNQNDADLLGDFLSGGGGTNNEAETSEPLMSFGTNEETPVSDASPSKFADSVPGTTWRSEPGSLMQTVDPRESKGLIDLNLNNNFEEEPKNSEEEFEKSSDSSSIISSSDNEYSSSADESDSESSSNGDSDDEGNLAAENLTKIDTNLAGEQEQSQESITDRQLETSFEQTEIMAEKESPDNVLEITEDVKVNEEHEILESDKLDEPANEEDDAVRTESCDIENNEMENKYVGMSEMDMMSVMEKLMQDNEEINEPPSFGQDDPFGEMKSMQDWNVPGDDSKAKSGVHVEDDNEGEEDSPSIHSGSSDSGSEENICTDSDVSGDEEVIGNWSPASPLYNASFGFSPQEEDEEENDERMEDDDHKSDTLTGYEYDVDDENGNLNDSLENGQQEKELNNLRANVKVLMEEMEAMVQDDGNDDEENSEDFIQSVVDDMDTSAHDADQIVPEVIKTEEKTLSIMTNRARSRERSRTPEHVKFFTPTNTLFYDPECPIVEKVIIEVADVLIDHDAEELENIDLQEESSSDKEDELENKNLESEVIKDLKEVYSSLEARGEIEGALQLLRESGIRNVDQIALDFAKEILEKAKETSDEKEHDFEENEKETDDSNNVALSDDYRYNSVLSRHEDISSSRVSEEHIKTTNGAEEEPVTLRRKLPSRHEEEVIDRGSMIIHNIDEESQMRPSHMQEVLSQIDSYTDQGEKASSGLITSDAAEFEENVNIEEEDFSELVHHRIGLDEVEVKHRRLSETLEDNLIETPALNKVTYLEQESEINGNGREAIEQAQEDVECFDNSLNETVVEVKPSVDHVTEGENEEDLHKEELSELESKGDNNLVLINQTGIQNSEIPEQICKKDLVEGEHRPLSVSKKASTFVKNLLLEVLDLIYWRDVKKTGVVFGSMVFVLLSLTFFTILSVLAYLSLAILTVTLSFRVYRNVMQAVQKSNEGHPFKKLLDMDIELKDEVVQDAADKIAANVNNCSRELRRLFLVEDYVDSLKFGLLLWLMTYIGSWFNGMTLVILAVVCIFTLPKVYETYKGPIDQNVNLVRTQLNNIMAQVSAKIPFPKKKAKTQ